MIHHILLFRPRPTLTADDRRALADAFEAAVRGIPGIRGFHIGRRVTHGREYELLMREDLPYAAVLVFDDVASLKAYLDHPAHEALGTRFMASLDAGLIYDYEMVDGGPGGGGAPLLKKVRQLLD
jgi:hypothetical protein